MSEANMLPALPPTIFDRAADRFRGLIKERRFKRAKRKLEQELANVVETANGHQAKRLPAGAPAYVALAKQASAAIDAFCATHGVARLTIEKDVPVLRQLERLAQPPSPAATAAKGLGAFVAVAVSAILIGCASGLVAMGYHWVVILLVR
jgi:hypothetical protein